MYLVRTRVCVYYIIYTYGVGYGVAVWIKRQYQSLRMRNGKIAVPLSFYVVMKAEHCQLDPLFYLLRVFNREGPLFCYVLTIEAREWHKGITRLERE